MNAQKAEVTWVNIVRLWTNIMHVYDDIVFKNESGHHDDQDTLQPPLYSNRAEIVVHSNIINLFTDSSNAERL